MSCPNDSSTIIIRIDKEERFVSYIYQRSYCGQAVTGNRLYEQFCFGKTLPEILALDFSSILKTIVIDSEEERFLLFVEWDAVRSAIGQYLGVEDEGIDVARCQTVAVKHDDDGSEITQFILPPNRLPDEKDRLAIFGNCGPECL